MKSTIKLFFTIIFFICAFNASIFSETARIAYIHFIDVGQADSILIDYGEFEILIDGGNNGDGNIVSDYLSDKVDGNLEIMLASHPHADHIGGLDTVLENYTVETIIDSGTNHTTKTYEDYMEAVKNEENAIFVEDDDMVFEIDEDVFFTVIEIVDNEADINNNSVICRLDVGEISFLFTGDLGSKIEKEYLHKFEETDVLKVGHHGSATATSLEFIQAITPKYAVISCGQNNQYGHPKPQTLDILRENNVITYRTDMHGTIVAETDGTGIIFNLYPRETEIRTAPQPSQPVTIENTVYVTQTGSKYHRENCSYLSKSSIAITIDEALENYEPCSRCN